MKRKRYRVGVWKVIRRGWETFNNSIGFRVDNRQRVKFWKDNWCDQPGELSLREAFPALFSIAIVKDAWAVEAWEHEGKGDARTIVSQDYSMIGRLEEVEAFFRQLQSQSIVKDVEDKMV